MKVSRSCHGIVKNEGEREMLRVKPITKKMEGFNLIKEVYTDAFPGREGEPISFLLANAKKGITKFEAHYDEEKFVGLSAVSSQGDFTYVQAIAVTPAGRGEGYGSQILSYIKETHPQNRIVLNLEVQDEGAKNAEQRKRRKEFYLKNGYVSTGIYAHIAGNDLETMVINGTCTAEELRRYLRKYYGFIISKLIKVKVWEE